MDAPFFDSLKTPDLATFGTLDNLDGLWVAEGDIHAANVIDRRVNDRSTLPNFSEEVYIIGVNPDRTDFVRRNLELGLTAKAEPPEFAARKHCYWAACKPFAVLVVQHSRLPEGDARKKGLVTGQGSMRIFWSKQRHKDGEVEEYIPTPSFPVCKTTGPKGEDWSWVNLAELAHIAGLGYYEIAPGFLSLKIFGSDSAQPSFVAAEGHLTLNRNTFQSFPSLKLPPGAVRTSFLAATHDASKDVLPENVWVAADAAEKVLRIASLGVKSHLAMIPTHYVDEPSKT